MSLPSPSPSSIVAVTGASAGIGAELGRELARRGHNLALVARDAVRLEDLSSELRAGAGVEVETFAADLTQHGPREELVRALEEGSREVVGLCNNAGVGSFGLFQELPFEGEARQVQLNVARGRGAILNVGSTAGFQPQPIQSTYSATKAFVNAFSEALHEDLRGTGVSCTVIAPGPVDTEFGVRACQTVRWRTGCPVGDARAAGPSCHRGDGPRPTLGAPRATAQGRHGLGSGDAAQPLLPAFRLLGSRLVERV